MQTNFNKYSVKNPSLEVKSKEHFNFINNLFNSYIKLKDFIDRKDLFIIVSRNIKNEIVGLTLVRETTVENYIIYRIVFTIIDEKYRGKGYNQELLDFVYEHGKHVGVKYIVANIRESNHSSIKSFLENGYKLSKKPTKPYKNGEKKIKIVKFVK